MKISAVIIAKNEAKKIKDCLESITWCDEILLIDNGSTDKTRFIARKYQARVIKYTQGRHFSDWRNKGLQKAKGDWILYLDADERITPGLRDEIKKVITDSAFSVYAIPRRNFIFGQEFKHGGQWPDYQKRLFRKTALKKWSGELHEEPIYQGELGYLKNPMIHLKHQQIEEMVAKTNHWSEIEARLMFQAHHPPMNVRRFLTVMLREFYLRFIKQLSFLDGPKGIIYGLYQIYSRFISYAKLWEMQIKKKGE